MKVRTAIARAWKLYTGHFGEMMLFMLLEVVLRLMVLAPMLFLASEATRLLALVSVPLFVLIVLPARQCAAEVMQGAVRGESIFSVRLCVTKKYWQKVLAGVRQALLLAVWAAPFLAATGYALRLFFGEAVVGQTDVFSLMMTVSNLGGGDIVTGVVYVMLMYVGLFLPFLAGCAFHSGRRHERALGKKKLLRGHHGGVVLTWLAGLATLIPFAAVAGVVSMNYLRALVKAVSNLAGGLVLPPLDQNVYIVLAAFVVLVLPLMPLKSMMTACYVHGLWEGKE